MVRGRVEDAIGGRGAGAAYSAVVMACTATGSPARRKISTANSCHVVAPELVT